MTPLVSVTIISYNQAQYLGEAIESIIKQDYPRIELVIADDASTDDSPEIIADYAARYPDIVKPIYKPENEGKDDNRHTAFLACTGEYIALLDADDVAEPERISKQMALMQEQDDCTLCYGNVYIIREGQAHKEELFFVGERIPREGDFTTLLQYDNFIPIAATMIRASALDDRGYHSAFGRTYSEGHLFARVTRHGTLRYIDEPLAGYRRHEASAMSRAHQSRSKVRRNKENACKAMVKEFTEVRPLAKYALARIYVDSAIIAIKAKDVTKLLSSLWVLFPMLPTAIRAYLDRRKGRYTLPGTR